MVAGLHLVLATACIAAVVGQGYSGCISAHWGGPNINSTIVTLQPVIIDASITDVTLDIPQTPMGCKVVGSYAYSCSVSPHDGVEFAFRDPFTIHLRLPYAQSNVKLNFFVHCAPLIPHV